MRSDAENVVSRITAASVLLETRYQPLKRKTTLEVVHEFALVDMKDLELYWRRYAVGIATQVDADFEDQIADVFPPALAQRFEIEGPAECIGERDDVPLPSRPSRRLNGEAVGFRSVCPVEESHLRFPKFCIDQYRF